MPGFWSGFAQGWEAEQDRIAKRKLFQQEILEKRRDALVPMVRKRQEQESEFRKAQQQVLGFFNGRLKVGEDLTTEEKDAFLNLISQDPEMGALIMKSVMQFDDENDTRLEGKDLFRYTKLMEDNKPDDMDMEEFVSIWAKAGVATSKGGFNAAATQERIDQAETTEELREIYGDITSAGSPGGSIRYSGGDESMSEEIAAERKAAEGGGSGSKSGAPTLPQKKDFLADYESVVQKDIRERVVTDLTEAIETENANGELTPQQAQLLKRYRTTGIDLAAVQDGKVDITELTTSDYRNESYIKIAKDPWYNKVLTDPLYQVDPDMPNYSQYALRGVTPDNIRIEPTPAPAPTVVTPNPTAQPGATVPATPDFTVDVPENDYAPNPYNPQEEEEDSGNPFMDKYN